MNIIEKTTKMAEPILADMGFELVRMMLSGSVDCYTLQIMAERIDRKNMTVDDCATISRALGVAMDVEDVLKDKYTLEVSSPGIDRPLITLADYERFKGFEAKIETSAPIEGQKRFKGEINQINGDDIAISFDDKVVQVPFGMIHKAKLVLTDELVASFLKNK